MDRELGEWRVSGKALAHLNPADERFGDRLLAGLLDDLPDAVIVLDPQGLLQWGNRAAERLFGRSLDTSVGLPALELVHPEDIELVLRSLTSVQGKKTGTLIEVRAKTAIGWRLLEVIGSPIAWFEGHAVLFCLRDLTERRRFEVAHNEEARLRSLVQNAAAVTMLVSPSGLVDSVSGALNRVLGHDPELVESRPLADLVSEPDRPDLLDAFERASRGASALNPVTVTVRLLRHASTETVPFELSLVNLIDDPTVGGFVVSAHDITARVAAELELRETLSLLTATLDSTADGILVVDTAGRITSLNRRFAAMWRVPDAILAARDDAAAIASVIDQLANPEAFQAKVHELYADPAAESSDTLVFKDGRVFERYSKPQYVDGVAVGRVWSFRDVTAPKRTEEELRESEQKFRQVFNQGPLGIALVDLDSRIMDANRALCRFVGRTKKELVGAVFSSFAHPEDADKESELARQISAELISSYQTETRFVTDVGDVVFGSVTASVIRGEQGTPIYGLRIVEDITKRKRLERELVAHATTAGKLLASFTARETEILALLCDGYTAPRIAERLSLSVRTVESHLANGYRKLGVRTREDAVAEFARLNLAVNDLKKGLPGSASAEEYVEEISTLLAKFPYAGA
ncbi:MAG: PAS domain S-box protein [Acidimicrobiales bacterium]